MKTMDDIKRLIREKEQAKATIDKEIVALKIELANIVLSEDEGSPELAAENEKMICFVGVTFKPGGKVYDYIWNGPGVAMTGAKVSVEARWGGWTEVEVVRVFTKPADACEGDYKCAYPAD